MHIENPPGIIRELTNDWAGERFANGRPKVSDDLLERMKLVTTEEAWGVLRRNGFDRQFAGDWFQTHPDKILVGPRRHGTDAPSSPRPSCDRR